MSCDSVFLVDLKTALLIGPLNALVAGATLFPRSSCEPPTAKQSTTSSIFALSRINPEYIFVRSLKTRRHKQLLNRSKAKTQSFN